MADEQKAARCAALSKVWADMADEQKAARCAPMIAFSKAQSLKKQETAAAYMENLSAHGQSRDIRVGDQIKCTHPLCIDKDTIFRATAKDKHHEVLQGGGGYVRHKKYCPYYNARIIASHAKRGHTGALQPL